MIPTRLEQACRFPVSSAVTRHYLRNVLQDTNAKVLIQMQTHDPNEDDEKSHVETGLEGFWV